MRSLLAIVLWLFPALVSAGDIVCAGYNPIAQGWVRNGADASFASVATSCPPGYAFISVTPMLGPRRPAEQVRVFGNCCPLPEDALVSEQVGAVDACPEEFIATGAKPAQPFDSAGCHDSPASIDACQQRFERVEQLILCTKINTARYKLGQRSRGVSLGWLRHFAVAFNPYSTRDKLPIAFRYAVGRFAQMKWSNMVCIGAQTGSWLTGKSSKYCNGFEFRELQYRGQPGDPAEGTPVRWWADCVALRNRLEPSPVCVP